MTAKRGQYPGFVSQFGTVVPDYRGMFLRGHGMQGFSQLNGTNYGVNTTWHNSGDLGRIQGDSTRELWGNFGGILSPELYDPFNNSIVGGIVESLFVHIDPAHVFPGKLVFGGPSNPEFYAAGVHYGDEEIRASRAVPVANEIRPANIAVKYMIRVR